MVQVKQTTAQKMKKGNIIFEGDWICNECGSKNISKRYNLWANPNEGLIRDVGNIEESGSMDWCYDCKDATVVIEKLNR